VRAWLTPSGLLLCVDRRFTDWLGRGQAESVGRAFSSMAEDEQQLERCRVECGRGRGEDRSGFRDSL
jgi:hypothetical protein